ncbi:hypothetical protein Tco_1400968 [Tanacetum coccineum]
MSMMGELKFFLGLQVHQSPHGIFISQSQYAIELLKKHGMDECVSMSTPMATSRLDIAFATFVCARYQARHMVKHHKEVKRIFRYLRQSYNMGLWYLKDSGFELISYSDANHVGYKDDYKSTSGGLQFLGEKLVSWSSKKQDCTTISTAEAEYVSLYACCAQVICMRTQLLDYGYKYNIIPMYCDSKSAIAISCSPVQHSRTKHTDIRYHFIKEHVEKGMVELYFVGTEYQLAVLFTKVLPKERFEYLVQRIADVHQDELCPPNKRYALMDANNKIDHDNPLYPNESKIMANIIQNHPLKFSVAASSSVPWIYLGQFWHTLQEDGSKFRLKFVLDRQEITMTLNDFKRIFHLPHATDNNHERFMVAPKSYNFKTTGLVQPWQTLSKIFARCLTTRVTGHDHPPLQIMQIACDKYYNLEDDVMVKNIFNSGKHKDSVGMKIPSWMITDEMKLSDHYRMSPNPDDSEGESSASRKSTVIRLRIPPRRSTRLIHQHQSQLLLRLEPKSDKESPEVEITVEVQPININEEEEESAEDDYKLK